MIFKFWVEKMFFHSESDIYWKEDTYTMQTARFPNMTLVPYPGCLEKDLAKTPFTDHVPRDAAPRLNLPWHG